MSAGLPPGYEVHNGDPAASNLPSGYRVSTTPPAKSRKRGALELISDALETPLALVNATNIDQFEGRRGVDRGSRTRAVFGDLLRGDFAEPAEQYGTGTPNVLSLEAQHGDPAAKFLQHHPHINALASLGIEFANPSNLLTGEVLGAGAKAV